MFAPYQEAYIEFFRAVHAHACMAESKYLTQKEFALLIKDLPFKGMLFTMRQGKTINEAWDRCSANNKYELLQRFMK